MKAITSVSVKHVKPVDAVICGEMEARGTGFMDLVKFFVMSAL